MNTKKATKRALLTSVMALVMCVVMLVGTTFAWFTDTASTGVNKIQAGNLDVQLLMRDASSKYVNIGDSHQVIFGDANSLVAQNNNQDTLWEPGKTQVAYLAVRNAGNLALKYNILLNVEDGGLIGALDYVIVPQGTKFGDDVCRDTVASWDAVKEDAAKLTAGTFTAAPNGCLDEIAHDKAKTNETEYFALVVHMDENAGNTYMSKSVTIDMKVVATQATAEFDSFDDQYDKDAVYPIVAMDTLQELINNAAGPVSAKLEGNIAGSLTVPQDKNITLDLNGFTLTGGDSHAILNRGTLCIKDSSGNGKIVASKANTSALRNGDNAVCVVEGGTFSRDGANGNTWHVVENFGKMTFNGGKVVLKNGNGFAITNGWNYFDPGASTTHAVMEINALELDTDSSGIKNCRYGDLTVNDVTVTSTGYWALSNDYLGTAVINGGTFTSTSFKAVSNGAAMTVNGGTFDGTQGLFVQSYATSTVLNGGTFANMEVAALSSYVGTGHTAQQSGTSVIIK